MYFCRKCDFQKHLHTQKHNLGEILINDTQKVAEKIYVCNCGKKYKHNQSLYNHKKKCTFIENNDLICIKYLRSINCPWNETSTATACEYGNYNILKYLIKIVK